MGRIPATPGKPFLIRRPLVAYTCAFTAGLLLAARMPPFLRIPLPLLWGLWAGLVLLRPREPARSSALFALFALIGLLYGTPPDPAALPSNHIYHLARSHPSLPLPMIGTVEGSPARYPDRELLTLRLERIRRNRTWESCTGKIRVTIRRPRRFFREGERLAVLLKPVLPRNFHNPGGFDYVRHLRRQDIYARAFLANAALAVPLVPRHPCSWAQALFEVRAKRSAFFDRTLPSVSAGVLKAMTLGERTCLSPAIRKRFQDTGVGHLLAVSGLHMGMVTFVSFLFFRWLLTRSSTLALRIHTFKAALALSFLPLSAYALLSGTAVSACRAWIMTSVFILGFLFDREPDPPTSLATAALIILAAWPGAIFQLGFQFSFLIVAGLLYAGPRLLRSGEAHSGKARVAGYMRATAVTAVLAALTALPLEAHYFNRIPLLAVPLNLLWVPLTGLWILPLALLGTCCFSLSPHLAAFLLHAAALPVPALVGLLGIVSRWSFAVLRTFTPNLLEMLLFFAACTALLNARKRWAKGLLAGVLVVGILDSGYWVLRNLYPPGASAAFLDVGQGSAAVLTFPGGSRMVIDGGGFAGGSFDTGERIVAPYLWNRKIMQVDYLVLTHPQMDHLGGLPFIAEHFRVKELWTNGVPVSLPAYRKLMSVVHRHGIRHRILSSNDPPFSIPGARITVLNPPPLRIRGLLPEESRDLNNASLVLLVETEGIRLLFPGDIEAPAERYLVRSSRSLRADVLLAPHHGSSTSSTPAFLQRVRPRIVVFSAGFRNYRHFPHSTVVRRYRRLGCSIYRTDRDGAVLLTWRRGRIRIRTTGAIPREPSSELKHAPRRSPDKPVSEVPAQG